MQTLQTVLDHVRAGDTLWEIEIQLKAAPDVDSRKILWDISVVFYIESLDAGRKTLAISNLFFLYPRLS